LVVLGNRVTAVDDYATFVMAEAPGSPIFMIPLKTWKLEKCKNFKYPVLPINKALYGLASSGRDWDVHAHDELTKLGWKEIGDVKQRIYLNTEAMLIQYVDDLILGAN